MNKPTFNLDALDLDRLEWQSLEDYEPPLNEWVVSRWESSIIEGLYAVSAVIWDGKKWYNADGEEVEVNEFAEVEGMNISAKMRQIIYRMQEADKWLSAWKSCIANGDKGGAAVAKERYVSARKTLDELEGRKDG